MKEIRDIFKSTMEFFSIIPILIFLRITIDFNFFDYGMINFFPRKTDI